MARLREAIGGGVRAGANGIQGSVVPVGHDVAFGWCTNARRKIYSADADYEDQPSEKSVHSTLLLANRGPVLRLSRFLCQSSSEPLFASTTIDGSIPRISVASSSRLAC